MPTYSLTSRSVAASPRSKRRGGASARNSASTTSATDLSGYLTRAEFARYFELVNVGTEDAPLTAIHALYDGLYSDGFVSAKGQGAEGSLSSGGGGGSGSGTIDSEQLATYLSDYAKRTDLEGYALIGHEHADYLTSSDLSGYAKTSDLASYVKTSALTDYVKIAALAEYVKKAGDTMTGTLKLPDLIATNSIKIGQATLTYNASCGAIHIDKGLYSDSFISSKGQGTNGSAASTGLDETALQAYLSGHGYLTSGALAPYATKEYVATALTPYAKTSDLSAYVKKTGDTMTGTLTLPDLTAINSIKIGQATLTYNASYGAIHIDKGLYSDSFISSKGQGSNGSASSSGASIKASLWGNTFTGSEVLSGSIEVTGGGPCANPTVRLIGNGASMALNIGSTGYHGLWDDVANAWLISLSKDLTQLQFSAGSKAVFTMPLKALLFESTVDTGTAPLTVASTTRVANLNADLLDGLHADAFAKVTDLEDYAKTSDLGPYLKTATLKLAVAMQFPGAVQGPSLRVGSGKLYLDYTTFGGVQKTIDVDLPIAAPASVAWSDITGKPSTFTPATHNHDSSYAAKTHYHTGVYAPYTHSHDDYVAASGYENFRCLAANRSMAMELNPSSSTNAVFFGVNYNGLIRIGIGDFVSGTSLLTIKRNGDVYIKGTLYQNQSSLPQ